MGKLLDVKTRPATPMTPAAAVLTSLEAAGVRLMDRLVAAGGTVYDAGDADRHLFFALEGLVRIDAAYGGASDGRRTPKEATTCLVGGGEVFGDPDLPGGGTRRDSAAALTPCRVALVRKDALVRHLGRNHGCALALLGAYSAWAERRERATARLLARGTRDRLADLLLELADRFGERVAGGVTVGARFTHEQLAAMVACTRESVTKEMALLKREGATETRNRGRIVLLDQRALAEAAGPRCWGSAWGPGPR